jgi:hypothetical protein
VKPRHLIPFVVLLLWQAAPVQVEQAPTGRVRLSIGVGGGGYPYDYTDCNGAPATGSDTYSSAGAAFEDRTAAGLRVSAFVGQYDIGQRSSFHSSGYLAGMQLAWEGRLAGLGGGWVAAGGNSGHGGLSAYLRLGDEDAVHLRADLRQPTPTWLVPGWARAGIAYHMGLLRGFGGFAGIGRVLGRLPMNGSPRDETAVFADATVPLGGRFDLLVRGHVGDRTTGLGLGARYTFK